VADDRHLVGGRDVPARRDWLNRRALSLAVIDYRGRRATRPRDSGIMHVILGHKRQAGMKEYRNLKLLLTLVTLALIAANKAHALSIDELKGISILTETYINERHKMIDNTSKEEYQNIHYHNFNKIYISEKGNVFHYGGFSPNSQSYSYQSNQGAPEKALEITNNPSALVAYSISGDTLISIRHMVEGFLIGYVKISNDKKSCQTTSVMEKDPKTGRVVALVTYPDQRGRPYEIVSREVVSSTCAIQYGNVFAPSSPAASGQ